MALNERQLAQLWVQAGGPRKYAVVMAKIAKRESGGNPKATNYTHPDHSIGLWQINQLAHKGTYGSDQKLMNPLANAKAAVAIFKSAKDAWGQPLKPWSTYNAAIDDKYIGANPPVGVSPPGGLGRRAAPASVRGSRRLVGGVDNSGLRTQLVSQFLSEGGTENPNAVIGLASGMLAAKDQAPRKIARRKQDAPLAPPGQGQRADSGGGSVKGFKLGSPVPGQAPHGSTHETSGLPGYPAYDYMAPAGTTVTAPVAGKVFKLSGSDPSVGGPPGGPLGYSIYIQGNDGKRYFLTHVDNVKVRVGQRVSAGQKIATVANGPASWSSPHVHMGVSSG